METICFTQYGISLFPIIIRQAAVRALGPFVLWRFVENAKAEIDAEIQELARRRELLMDRGLSRRDRVTISRYYDLGLRVQKLRKSAVDELMSFSEKRSETSLLDTALAQWEKAQRLQKNRLRMRLDLEAVLCEQISAVNYERPLAA